MSPSKVVIKSAKVRVVEYLWENDTSCQVPDPTEVKPAYKAEASGEYIFAALPERMHTFSGGEFTGVDPCYRVNKQKPNWFKTFKANPLPE